MNMMQGAFSLTLHLSSRIAMCTNMFEISPRPLDELVPNFEESFEDIGGYWMLDE